MARSTPAFSYKPGSSFVHRLPAWVKILLVPALSIAFFKLPPVFSLGLFVLQTLLACFLRFSLREQLSDLRAVLYYAFFLIFARVFMLIFSRGFSGTAADVLGALIDMETVIMLLKLFCVMQSASILFRTSTSLQIREGLERIELALRGLLFRGKKKGRTPVAEAVSLFICFIPMVARIWEQSKRAWCARGGKNGIRMYMALLPVLFSVGMKQAYNSARAISIRRS